jgi:putative oxidoreductase
MNELTQTAPDTTKGGISDTVQATNWERAGVCYARVALGAAFLSAVASRFGLWDKTLDLKHFASFMQYAAEVNSFLPRAAIPFVAWAATVGETSCGILLVLGLWTRWVSLASAILLALFGTAMAISFGLKSPMDYSVFSASGAAVLLTLHAFRQDGKRSLKSQSGSANIMKRRLDGGTFIAILVVASLGATKLSAQKQNDEQLLGTRDAVWRAWFAGDTKTLEELVPQETIVISGGEEKWKNRADVIRTAVEFHEKSGKLVRLEFPHTEVQHFGEVAIVWSSYIVETEVGGKRSSNSGRATEIFVWRHGHWSNPGWHTSSTY